MADELTQRETILVVDDEPAVCVSLEAVLSREGYHTVSASSGLAALETLEEQDVDLVLLDLNMPQMSGLELMHIVHERWPHTMILVLTGYGTLQSAVKSLRYGAYDYLLKPSTPDDLKASVRRGLDKYRQSQRRLRLLDRIQASVQELTREDADEQSVGIQADQGTGHQTVPLKADNLVIDLKGHRATMGGRELTLTPIELSTLVALVRNRGRVLTYSAIVKDTHGYDCSEKEARSLIKTHISHLRHKMTHQTGQPCPIANVRGVGYMWPDVSSV